MEQSIEGEETSKGELEEPCVGIVDLVALDDTDRSVGLVDVVDAA
jgi:hypothetical protein